MKRIIIVCFIAAVIIAIGFRMFCGIFVIQPLGALPEGATIIYWRTDLNLPFITSADGLLMNSEVDVSLLSRALVLGALSKPILEKEIFRLGYSEWLYLQSTNGNLYEK